MDRIDRTILSALQNNARISNVKLAIKAGLSHLPSVPRITIGKLGIIDGYHANLNAARMGHDVLVLMQITLRGQSAEMMAEFEAAAADIPQVRPVF